MKNAKLTIVAAAALALSSAASFAGEPLEDAALTAKVKTALIGDPVAKAYEINVESKNGVVQLNGFVDSTGAREAAEKAARSVSGIKQIDNNLEVRPGERSMEVVAGDAAITTKVKTALATDDPGLAMDVNVDTNNGEVLLSGFVDNDAERARAAEKASSVEGVRKVHNELLVSR
jgi:hyperosmotically inducible protein